MLPLCRYASTEVARQRYWLGAPRPVLARTQTALRAGKPNREAAVPQTARTAQLQLKMRNFKQAAANTTIRRFRGDCVTCTVSRVPIELNRDTLRVLRRCTSPICATPARVHFLFQKTVIYPTLRQRGLAEP